GQGEDRFGELDAEAKAAVREIHGDRAHQSRRAVQLDGAAADDAAAFPGHEHGIEVLLDFGARQVIVLEQLEHATEVAGVGRTNVDVHRWDKVTCWGRFSGCGDGV